MEFARALRGLAWSLLAAAALLGAEAGGTGGELTLNPWGLGLSEAAESDLGRAIETEDWPLAEKSLFEAVRWDSENADLRRALGIAHYQAGRHFLAASELKRADAIEPLGEESRYLLASAYLRMGRPHWARAELESLIYHRPENPKHLYSLASIFYEQQRFGAGASALRRALLADPGFADAHDLLGQCLEGLGRSEEALAAYRRAIAVREAASSPSAWAHYHLGSLLHDLGELEAAATALAAAVDVDAGHVPAHRELGVVLLKTGQIDDSASVLETAAGLAPDDAAVQYALARAYRLMGNSGLAASALRRFRELSRRDGL